MALVAVISRAPRIEIAEWVELVRMSSGLAPPPPRLVTNPFTGKEATVAANTGTTQIFSGGVLVGAIEPSEEFAEDGELRVYSSAVKDGALRTIIAGLARTLGAEVEWIPP